MARFYLGSDGLWKHKGWVDVAPGDSPLDPTVPTGGGGGGTVRTLRFYTTDIVSNGSVPGSGGGGTGGGTVPTGSTYFGAEPQPAGNGTTNQQSLVNKWQGRPSSRQFFGANWGTPVHIAGVSVAQFSWGPKDAQVVSGSMDATLSAAFAAMKNGDIATYAHESDNDGLTAAQITTRIQAMNRFYDLVKSVNPNIYVAPTHTGYMFSPKNGGGAAARATWGAAKGDLVGLDLDGVHIDAKKADGTPQYPGATDYSPIDYAGHIPIAKAFITANKARGYVGWTVPEHMTSRYTPIDPNGTKRAAWFQTNMTYILNGGAYACMIFDFPRPANLGGESTTAFSVIPNPSPELTVIRSFVAGNPANPA